MSNLFISFSSRGSKNFKKKIQGIKSRIDDLKNDPSNFDLNKLRLLRKELGHVYKDEEAYWKQKSRTLWLLEGNKNTFFFIFKRFKGVSVLILRGLF